MKKTILLLFLSLLLLNFSFAQRTKVGDTTRHVNITYDFFSKDPLQIMRWSKNGKLQTGSFDVRKLYYGDKINFRVRVNPFLYDVKVNGNNLFENSPLDTAYTKTFMAFFNTVSGSNKPDPKKPDNVKKAEDSITMTAFAMRTPRDNELMALKNIQPANKNARAAKKSEIKAKEIEITKEKNEAALVYDSLRTKLTDQNETIYNFFYEYQHEKTMLENILLFSLADYKEYDSIIKEINSYIIYMRNDSTKTFNIDSLKESTEFVLREWQSATRREARQMQAVFGQMRTLNRDYSFSNFEEDSILYYFHKSLADSMEKENIANFSRAYSGFLQNLGNRSLFEKNYIPEFAVADSFRFQIEISPSARARDFISLYKVPVRDTAFKPYTLPVKRFLKLNISVGLAFMFGGAVPSSYYYSIPKDQIEDDDTVLIKKGDSKASVIPRIGLFTHLYWTNASWVKPAITFGLSTNPADPSETAYMGGMSLILGQNRRMVISGGMALANTDVLKSRYKVDEIRKKSYYTGVEETDLIEKKLSYGGFLGISYNF